MGKNNELYSCFCSFLITSCANEGAHRSLQSNIAICLILWYNKDEKQLFNKALLPLFELFKRNTVATKKKYVYAYFRFAACKVDCVIDWYVLLPK